MEHKKVFISYSWDSNNHQEWVLHLVNQLRKKGINATADVFETQIKSIHLPQMMVDKIRESDFIIVVLSEDYAKKADQSRGGVGFESRLLLPLLMENPDKLVCIMRHTGNYKEVFPFQLKGQYAIDFSNELQFEKNLKELIYRIYKQPMIYQEPLGESPIFSPRVPKKIIEKSEEQKDIKDKNTTLETKLFNIEVPSLKRITDRDIEMFLKENFKELINLFNSLFDQIQHTNPEFEFDKDDISIYKSIFKLYVDGANVNTIKIWYGDGFGGNTINLSYGSHINSSDGSANEIIRHHIDDKKQLKLLMSMNMYRNNKPLNPQEVVQEIWKNNISHTIK